VTAVRKLAANSNARRAELVTVAEVSPAIRSRDFLERQAFEAFKSFVLAFRNLVTDAPTALVPNQAAPTVESSDVMTADEAAAFLGVDRNTVYDYAGRGIIPHQRLGKRILFRRGTLVSWLDSSLCKATSTRKG
jgi:excisionase family DNA binding protein